MPQVRGSGQGGPAMIPAVTTVTAAVPAMRTFIHAATALRRSQTRELLSPFSQPATRPDGAGPRPSAPGLGPDPTRSGASVVILHPPLPRPPAWTGLSPY